MGNTSVSGGFVARGPGGDVDDVVTGSHLVHVGDLVCYAEEARFGGIVVQPWDVHHPKHPDHRPEPGHGLT